MNKIEIEIPNGKEIINMKMQKLKKERRFFVYKHTSPSNKVYIGITCKKNIKQRWGKNGRGYKECPYFYKAIQKYGWDNIQHEILFIDLSEKEAQEKEIELISFYKSNNPEFGYNLTSGGEGRPNYVCSQETKDKMSKNNGAKNPKYRQQYLDRLSGENNPMKNPEIAQKFKHPLSEETKKKISERKKGKSRLKEVRDKLKQAHIGLTASEETRKKMSESHKKHPSIVRKVYQYDLQNNLIKIWKSVRQIERELHLEANKIYACCNNKIENYANYIWQYENS